MYGGVRMGPVFYFIAILGCGDAAEACEPVSLAPARYQSAQACVAASEETLARLGADVLYPVVTAQCRQATGRVSLDRLEQTSSPLERRILFASR